MASVMEQSSPLSSYVGRSATRQGSVIDLDIDMFLKISNYEDTVRQLDIYYGIVKRQILQYQSSITGLFPQISSDKVVGSVRESIYCAAAIWSLYQAYRRIDDDRGKSHELGQSTVKCMRGILECWMKQASRIELFKRNQCDRFSLHCKFHLDTGSEIFKDEDYYHLQIDVVSLYLIFLVQMITSGLQIIYTQDEVAFIQNLVYYVERAYRTPDYGMWERGSRYNDGTPEIHASSIGMAKSALEAINGCNLFGEKGASWSVIYVDIDAHNRNRSIFETMLPRESSSKSVDTALLPTISFPAFATHEEVLYTETKANIVRRLKGVYGFKRFGRDGFKTVLEDPNRRYYRPGEIKEFDNVECEWPLFYIFMIIDGVFKSFPEQVEEYQNLLKARLHKDINGDPIIPMYFYVPEENLEAEKNEPGSTMRIPSEEVKRHRRNSMEYDGPHIYLWNQAMFVIAQLLTASLLHINELDPIRRYLPSYNRPRRAGRYSAFQAKPSSGTHTDLVVQIVLIAESMRLQAMMATYGIQTQTPHEVEPVQILSSSQLVKVYEQLGINSKLNLQGRPSRPIGSLGTSKIYRVCGMTVLCYPLIFEVSDFYLYRDMALLIDDIKTELQFVGKYWRLSGRPTVCLLIREEHMRDPQFKEMLDLFAMLKKGYCDGIKVRIGRLQNLISSSCIEHLDFLSNLDIDIDLNPFKQLEHDYIGYQSLTDVPRALSYAEEIKDYKHFMTQPLYSVLDEIRNSESLYAKCQLYEILLKREGINYEFNGKTVGDHLRSLYQQAGGLRYWMVVRYCSSLLNHTVDSISPFITGVLVKGKQLTVGVIGHEETVFDKPMTPAEIQSVVYSTIQPHNVVQAVLQQEILLYCGRLIGTNPEMFKGILKIRIGWVLEAMNLYLKMTKKNPKPIENYSPYEIRQFLIKVLTVKDWATAENLSVLERRKIEGSLCRVPVHFYNQVWEVLLRCPGGICVNGRELPQQPTLSNMTRSELTFALLVESILHHIQLAEFRQIVVELLNIVSTILLRNPELTFKRQLDLNKLVDDGFDIFCKDHNLVKSTDMSAFFSAHYSLTTGCLARAVVNNVLTRGCVTTDIDLDVENNEMCKVT
ncbi:probable phosphorylase b kinase regulatory subunit beta isoform X1 [Leptopilina heterotoma]|uniref:probable phosphorylase b kinase regulatory subunit beta isoform X1 n=1 Tax=Leptopilina heterotoma TaxID=63436 RepID=UPI001CA97BD3|nr:probable phosphorylase b kinase regulatory subunit beta isoform X1 [Leptopilina heterotoma]XP_043476952.1 probable phosphorylase b kinase regulatory subunit beta isoform X1 [Leptopilina heterotoma]